MSAYAVYDQTGKLALITTSYEEANKKVLILPRGSGYIYYEYSSWIPEQLDKREMYHRGIGCITPNF